MSDDEISVDTTAAEAAVATVRDAAEALGQATPTVEREWAVIWPRRADGHHDDCDVHTADGQCVETRGSEGSVRDLVRRYGHLGARVGYRELSPWTAEEAP